MKKHKDAITHQRVAHDVDERRREPKCWYIQCCQATNMTFRGVVQFLETSHIISRSNVRNAEGFIRPIDDIVLSFFGHETFL